MESLNYANRQDGRWGCSHGSGANGREFFPLECREGACECLQGGKRDTGGGANAGDFPEYNIGYGRTGTRQSRTSFCTKNPQGQLFSASVRRRRSNRLLRDRGSWIHVAPAMR